MSVDQQKESRRYRDILAPIFSPPTGMHARMLEYACALVRFGGMQGPGWDAVQESSAVLQDLVALRTLELPAELFADPEKTRWRLGLVSYVHLTEMDAPYHVLANLLRVYSNMRYVFHPFARPAKRREKKRPSASGNSPPPPSPASKIRVISELACHAGLSPLGGLFDDFYYPDLRNAIAHSDYVLHAGEFRMLKGRIPEEGSGNVLTSAIPLQRLGNIITRAFGFYSAFFALQREARAGFAELRGKCFPVDFHDKGLVEFVVDSEGLLCGFKVHWPNQRESLYRRTLTGCEAKNLILDPNNSLGFMLGWYVEDPHPIFPLISRGEEPRYTSAEGADVPPEWPSDDAPRGTFVSYFRIGTRLVSRPASPQ